MKTPRLSFLVSLPPVFCWLVAFSAVGSAATVAAPTFSPSGGTYTAPQTVTLSTTTPGASINYTLDGSRPSETAGIVYSAPITISGTTTVKAIAYATGLTDSTVATATYTIKAVAPTFSPAGGTYTAPQMVTLSSANSGASINYTLDGTAPSDTAGTVYTAPITISGTTTVKAIAYATGLTDSTVATATYTIKAVAPTFSPAGGTYTAPQMVTLSSANSGASINYTLDGTAPSDTAGTVYTAPITISGTTTVKAIAYATGLTDSTVATATYTIKAIAPTFSPAGGTYNAPQTVTLSTTTSGATIRYTLDGTAPSDTAGTIYTAPFAISGTTTVKAIAYASGLTDSTVATATYTIKAVAPTFSPAAGTYNAPQTVTLSTTTPGASINYTLDGTAPSDTAGTVYTAPITISGTTTVKAIAYATGLTDSTVATATYTIKAVAPTFSLAAGTYTAPQTVTLSTTTPGASINYTLDGTAPSDTAGTVYTAPITISGTTTVKAIAYATGLTDSTVATATYTIKAVAPTFSPAGGTYTAPQAVTLTSTTTGASINYTLDGSTPSDTAGTVYTAPLTVSATTTLKAIAYAIGLTDSTVATATYTIKAVAPTFSPAGGTYTTPQTVTLSTTTPGASINYTLDGSTPSDSAGTVYTAPLTISWTTTVKAVAYATGVADSTVATARYTIPGTVAIASLNPTSGPVGAAVTITGSGYGSTQGSSTVTFNGVSAGTASNWSGTSITVNVPIGATTGNVVVTVGTVVSNGLSFTVILPPSITSLNPTSGLVGAPVTITGSNFGSTQGSSTVTFNGIGAGTAGSWSGTSITVSVPSGATSGNVVVTTAGGASNGVSFTVIPPPSITSLSPASAAAGALLTIAGSNFGSPQGSSTVTFNGISAGTASSWNNGSITVNVPSGATTGPVLVTVGGAASNPVTFTVMPVPSITSVTPATGAAGAQVNVYGSGFGSQQGTGSLWLGTARGTVITWSDTQIGATVASNATSGNAQVQQGGAWSNTVPFTVNTATISTIAPITGVPGVTMVTISGSGFGAAQGIGQVWLGTANGVVQSWSDTQVVAQVAAGAASGNAQILQGGVMSNAVPFTVDALQIASINPTSGLPGTQVTFTGSGFGSSPGTGVVWLGSTAGQIVSWSDSTVVATVAQSALTGIARIQQNGAWSNALPFAVPATGGNTLVPSLLNMSVGDTHTIQALNAAGLPLAGLTWLSSDPTIVSLSTDDPPLLTALAAGEVTITAGTASADVTVFAGALPLGTVIWSNPGDGSGVQSIVPAVPSTSGVADVFAFQADGTVQAITSDGTTAWTADVSQAGQVLPDFQGGLVVVGQSSIYKLDGITGQPDPAYTVGGTTSLGAYGGTLVAVHPDGTIFAVQRNFDPASYSEWNSVIGIDPTTGAQKFSVDLDSWPGFVWDIMIAGDGNAYVAYSSREYGPPGSDIEYDQLKLLQVNSSGASASIEVYDWEGGSDDITDPGVSMITNADQGVLLTWSGGAGGMAVTAGSSVSLVSAPQVPGGDQVVPVLQAQDGSFIGTTCRYCAPGYGDMVAFDASGTVRWTVPNETPHTSPPPMAA
jgi:hypothetical protein